MQGGSIQVYTGLGKGKTSAALGLALRAVGHGLHVCMVQFMKTDQEAGEVRAAHLLAPYLSIYPIGRKGFLTGTPEPIDYKMARKALAFSREIIEKKGTDVLILDEINVAVHYGLITVQDVLALMDLKPNTLELVLTGRDAPPEIIKRADLVTEMVAVKHYFDRGIPSRKGIET